MVKGFVQVDNELRRCIIKDCGMATYVVYETILSHRITNEKHGIDGDDRCFPSRSIIAEECDCSEENIKKHIKKLVDKTYLIINSGSSGKANNYWFPKEKWFVETDNCKSASRRKGTNKKKVSEPLVESTPTKPICEEITDNIEKDFSLTLDSTDNNIESDIQANEVHTNVDLIEYLQADYNVPATLIKSKFIFNRNEVILSMFMDQEYTKKLDWMDSKNTYKDDKHRFNAHCSYILKHYENELAEWKAIEERSKRDDARSWQIADGMNELYSDEIGPVQGGTIQEYNSYSEKVDHRNMIVNGDEEEIDLPY